MSEPLVPKKVLKAIESLGRGETASKEEIAEALKWDLDEEKHE